MRSNSGIPRPAIEVRDVSKKYKLYHSPFERLKAAFHLDKNKNHKEFEALRGIHFTLQKGRTLGIIGRNGSGKSTLLQLIAGVLKPSSGSLSTQGRIASLLELGAGFNPEFTGRENVFLSGMLSGISKKELNAKMSEIERFADIGEYFDQPVRTYSSGMFVRLAFSTVIHTDPDIFLIDEALAVGDARFQQKCYQKLKDFQKLGKTIIFVTHDMDAIVRHSDQALLLEKGQIKAEGAPSDVVHIYHEILMMNKEPNKISVTHAAPGRNVSAGFNFERFLEEIPAADLSPSRNSYNKNEHRYGNRKAQILDFVTVCDQKYYPSSVLSESTFDIYLKIRFYDFMKEPLVGFSVKTIDGVVIYGVNSWLAGIPLESAEKGQVRIIKCSFKADLHYGDYMLEAGIAERVDNRDELADARSNFIHFHVEEKKHFEGLASFTSSFEEIPLLQGAKK